MAAISALVAAINAGIPASGALAGITFQLGAEFLMEQVTPPRIVWVPTEEQLEAAEDHGPNAGGWAKGYPRSLATRVVRMEVHLWARGDGTAGGDHGAVEDLLNAFVNSARANAYGAFVLQRGRWMAQDGAAIVQYGREYVLDVTWRIPVPETTPTDRVITGMTETLQVNNGTPVGPFGP